MAQIKIPFNRIEYLVKEMESEIDSSVLNRGWDYFHRGYVSPLELIQGTELRARVRGTKRYEVVLDLSNFGKSDCSCPYGSCCKHMAAVLFQAYAPYGRPELLLARMVKEVQTRRRPRTSSKSSVSERPKELSQKDFPRQWQEFFDRRFSGYALSHQQSIEGFYTAAVEMLEPLAVSWNPLLRGLFRLNVGLFILRRINQFQQTNSSSYLSYYFEGSCRTVIQQCRDRLEETARSFDREAAADKYPRQWKETMDILREQALEPAVSVANWMEVYRFFWWDVFIRPQDSQEEQERLAKLSQKTDMRGRREDVLRLALSHFDIMADRDDEAFQKLDNLHERHVSDFFSVLNRLLRSEQWDRLVVWLRWLLPAMPKAKQDDFLRVSAFWTEAMKHQPSDEEWVRAMRQLLPRSYYSYTDYLMKSGRYREWVDLQLSNRIPPLNLYVQDLKTVEAHHPELLLPLYHQGVERSILEKNRASYKIAVRQLRKLHSCYKKLKQLDRWEEYINRLSVKYSRLRAFQEELKKGKWLS